MSPKPQHSPRWMQNQLAPNKSPGNQSFILNRGQAFLTGIRRRPQSCSISRSLIWSGRTAGCRSRPGIGPRMATKNGVRNTPRDLCRTTMTPIWPRQNHFTNSVGFNTPGEPSLFATPSVYFLDLLIRKKARLKGTSYRYRVTEKSLFFNGMNKQCHTISSPYT